jgi:hypothetical protein
MKPLSAAPATVLTETETTGRKAVVGERIGYTLARTQRFTSIGWETWVAAEPILVKMDV